MTDTNLIESADDARLAIEVNGNALACASEAGPIQEKEIPALGRKLAEEYHRQVATCQKHYGLNLEEAQLQVSQPAAPVFQNYVLQKAPQDVNWGEVSVLATTDANLALQRTASIREAARDELQSGQRCANALMTYERDTPWIQQQYLAMCDEISDQWQPKNGIERTLVQQAAIAQTLVLHWLEVLTARSTLEYEGVTRKTNTYKAPFVTEAAAIEQAAAMVEQFQKMLLCFLRALADQRKLSVVIQKAGQVNISDQQINVAPGKS